MSFPEHMHNQSPNLRHSIRTLRQYGALDLAERLEEYVARGTGGSPVLCGEAAELMAQFSDVTSRKELVTCLGKIPDIFGCSHYALFPARSVRTSGMRRVLETNYPAFWLMKYTLKGYAQIDPILKVARDWHDSFYWDEAHTDESKVDTFFRDAARSGIGPGGFTAVHRMQDGNHIAFCLSSPVSAAEFRDRFEPLQETFMVISKAACEAFFQTNFPRSNGIKLKEEELAYLVHLWNGGRREDFRCTVAGGATALEQSIKSTVKCKTFEQAMMQVASMGMLETPEFLLQTLIADMPQQMRLANEKADKPSQQRPEGEPAPVSMTSSKET